MSLRPFFLTLSLPLSFLPSCVSLHLLPDAGDHSWHSALVFPSGYHRWSELWRDSLEPAFAWVCGAQHSCPGCQSHLWPVCAHRREGGRVRSEWLHRETSQTNFWPLWLCPSASTSSPHEVSLQPSWRESKDAIKMSGGPISILLSTLWWPHCRG